MILEKIWKKPTIEQIDKELDEFLKKEELRTDLHKTHIRVRPPVRKDQKEKESS